MKTNTIKNLKFRVILTVVLGLIFSYAAAAQSNNFVRQVQLQLNRAESFVETKGLSKMHNYGIDSLAQNEKDSYTFNLQKGWDYVLIGVCDDDCSNIDITVFDENNNQAAKDNSRDDKPFVTSIPKWTGKFSVVMHMYKCRSNPCYYGIGVFGSKTHDVGR